MKFVDCCFVSGSKAKIQDSTFMIFDRNESVHCLRSADEDPADLERDLLLFSSQESVKKLDCDSPHFRSDVRIVLYICYVAHTNGLGQFFDVNLRG